MARVKILKLGVYLPQAGSLKEKRKIRSSLVDRIKRLNASVIEFEDQDIQNHLVLLISFSSLDEYSSRGKKERIMEIIYEESEHVRLEEESVDIV